MKMRKHRAHGGEMESCELCNPMDEGDPESMFEELDGSPEPKTPGERVKQRLDTIFSYRR